MSQMLFCEGLQRYVIAQAGIISEDWKETGRSYVILQSRGTGILDHKDARKFSCYMKRPHGSTRQQRKQQCNDRHVTVAMHLISVHLNWGDSSDDIRPVDCAQGSHPYNLYCY